jgi:hypothetical protein
LAFYVRQNVANIRAFRKQRIYYLNECAFVAEEALVLFGAPLAMRGPWFNAERVFMQAVTWILDNRQMDQKATLAGCAFEFALGRIHD